MTTEELDPTVKSILIMRVVSEVSAVVLDYAYASDERKEQILADLVCRAEQSVVRAPYLEAYVDRSLIETVRALRRTGTYGSEGSAVGATVGAAAGAAVGGIVGAAIGGGLGSIIGEVIGNQIQK